MFTGAIYGEHGDCLPPPPPPPCSPTCMLLNLYFAVLELTPKNKFLKDLFNKIAALQPASDLISLHPFKGLGHVHPACDSITEWERSKNDCLVEIQQHVNKTAGKFSKGKGSEKAGGLFAYVLHINLQRL